MRHILFVLALVTLPFAAACSASSSSSGAQTSDAGPDACAQPLSGFHCPATFDAARSGASCPAYAQQIQVGACGASLVYDYVIGASETWCFYDPSSKALVGARYQDDVPDLCNNTTNEAVAGHVEATCAVADAGAVQCIGDAGGD